MDRLLDLGLGSAQSAILLGFLAFGISLVCSIGLLPRHRHGEPPRVKPSIPVFGHLIGLMTKHVRYIVDLSKKYGHPIFTLPVPLATVYVVSDPRLLQDVDKNWKSLDLWAVESEVLASLGNLNSRTRRIIKQANFHHDFSQAMARGTTAATSLEQLTAISSAHLLAAVKDVRPGSQMLLWNWTRTAITRATLVAVYGPHNPYAAREIEDAAWTVIDSASVMMSGPLARILAPRACASRERIAAAFEAYYAAGGHEQASVLAQGRRQAMEKSGLSLAEQARLEMTFCYGLVGNSTPTAFWVVYHTCSDAGLLAAVRTEVDRHVSRTTTAEGTSTSTLDVTALRKSALLSSLVHESLRYHSASSGARRVVADTDVAGGAYTLRKGAYVLLPTAALHSDSGVWGESVGDFNAWRFASAAGDKSKAGFRGFGGGPTLCPGRHFAIAEISVLLALLVLRFDLRPADNDGKTWPQPTPDESKMFELAPPPIGDVAAVLEERAAWRSSSWHVKV